MISVVIPTYKSPDALDLCLKSLIEGQQSDNQVVVVVDGFFDLNKSVLTKYSSKIDILDLKQNVGLCRGTNYGVYSAKHDLVLVVNDDNVFPKNWDVNLLKAYKPGSIVTPNQIEPRPSIFKQFLIKDLGTDPSTFNLANFWEFEQNLNVVTQTDDQGSTLPFLIAKQDYLKIGGWDENYPGGLVADWDFFYKGQLAGLEFIRTYSTHFYHFESFTTKKTPEMIRMREQQEAQARSYARFKWGGTLSMDSKNHKYIAEF
jgi:GT2 family glycosyltransferase